MAETPTAPSTSVTRPAAAVPDRPPALEHKTFHFGERHRCPSCYEHHETRVTPSYICHHCGSVYCADCAPELPGLLRWLFQHQELKSIFARGRRRSFRDETEAAHCEDCHHRVPRMVPWAIVGLFLALLFAGLLFLFSERMALFLGGPLLFFVGWVAVGFAWRVIDSRYRQKLFFPVYTDSPIFEIREEFIAEGELNGHYKETFQAGTPRGVLSATILLSPTIQEEMDEFARVHHLDDQHLADIKGSAGHIFIEKATRAIRPSPPWPEEGGRAWELSAPLAQWQYLWDKSGEPSKRFEFRYDIKWNVPRKPFNLPFPIQLHAHFPERSERRTLELGFALTTWMPSYSPILQKVTLQRGPGLPRFSWVPVQGRPIGQQSQDEIEVEDVQFDKKDNIARLQLRFEEPPPDEEAWLTGTAQLFIPAAVSDISLASYYTSFGVREPRPRHEIPKTIATLHFRVNVASLAYENLTTHTTTFWLDRSPSEESYDALIEALDRESKAQLVRIHARYFEGAMPGSGQAHLPGRDIMGYWPATMGEELRLVVFHIELQPLEEKLHVKIEVEASENLSATQRSQAQAISESLRNILEGAPPSKGSGNGGSGGGGTGGSPPSPSSGGGGSRLLSKVKEGR